MSATVVHPEAFHTPERKIRLLLASLPFFAGLLGTDGTVLECNFAELGSPLEEKSDWVGRPFESGAWWNYSEDSRSEILLMLGRAREGHRSSKERLYARPDGTMGVMMLSLVPLFAPYGQPDAILVMAVDVTERRRASGSYDQIAMDMAHRLRNSFSIMRLMATRSEAEPEDAARARLTQRLSRMQAGHRLANRYLFYAVPIDEVVREAVPDPQLLDADFVPVSVPARDVEALLLALGELARPGHSARVTARREGHTHLSLQWHEAETRPDSDMPGPLSTLLLQDGLAMQTDGTVSVTNDENGYRWMLTMPIESARPGEATA